MLIPTGNKVLIERIEQPLSSVIIQPEKFKQKSVYGKVLAIGPNVRELAADMYVYIAAYSGTELNWNECKCVMISEDAVLCIEQAKVVGEVFTDTQKIGDLYMLLL